MKSLLKNDYGILVALMFVLAAPPILVKFGAMNSYYISILIFMALNTMIAVGLNLLVCHAGQISLGHAAFYGIGAYTSAILTVVYGCPLWVDVIAAMVLSGVIAYLVGAPTLKLKGHYLAVATMGLGIIAFIVMNEWHSVTEGPSGIVGIPRLRIFETVMRTDMQVYYLYWAIALIVILVAINILNSRVGRALRALHGSETAAAAMGVNVNSYKVKVFVISAVFAGLAGSLYAHYMTFISPPSFGLQFSIMLVLMIIVGGAETIWGALIGAVLITSMRAFLGEALGAYKDYDVIVYGLVMMVVMIFIPAGLAGGISIIARRLKRGSAQPEEIGA